MSTTGYAYAILLLSVVSAIARLQQLNILNLMWEYLNKVDCDRTETKPDNHPIQKNTKVIAWLIFYLFIILKIEPELLTS